MFCRGCGSAMPEGAGTCSHCGLAVAPGFSPQPQPILIPSGIPQPYPAAPAASPVFLMVTLVAWIFFAPLGFVLSIVGVINGPRRGCFGAMLATAFLGGLAACVLLALVIPKVSSGAQNIRHTEDCRNHLRQLGGCVALYETRYNAYPSDLKSLWRPDFVADPALFLCPARSTQAEAPPLPPAGAPFESFASQVAYDYRRPASNDKSEWGKPLAWDRVAHPDGKRCVLFADLRVEFFDQASFERLTR